MNAPDHHEPPTVCPHCMKAFFASVESLANEVRFVHCAHRGPGTLVRCDVVNGRITTWRLACPVTLEQAQQQIDEHSRMLAKAGLLDLRPTVN